MILKISDRRSLSLSFSFSLSIIIFQNICQTETKERTSFLICCTRLILFVSVLSVWEIQNSDCCAKEEEGFLRIWWRRHCRIS